MSKSILAIPHLVLALITLVAYLILAVTLLYHRISATKHSSLVKVGAWVGLIGVFLLVDTGFYMNRVDLIITNILHHPLALAALFAGGAASILAIISRRRATLAAWALYLSLVSSLLLVLTSLFTHG